MQVIFAGIDCVRTYGCITYRLNEMSWRLRAFFAMIPIIYLKMSVIHFRKGIRSICML